MFGAHTSDPPALVVARVNGTPFVAERAVAAAPRISVIMPVYNGASFLPRSLPPLSQMKTRGEILELLVVDDGSTDESAGIAAAAGAEVVPTNGRGGPGKARNLAAERARGDVLWFVDADVVVHADAAVKLRGAFADPAVVAVFGSYDDRPPASNFLSQYKNLVHHHYHHRGASDAATFWAGCGAVRRRAFLAVRGFDTDRYRRPSIEDIELGYRLRDAGGRIRLLPEIQGTHLKVWRLVDLVRTEVFQRAIPWSRLLLERDEMTDDLNVGRAERARAALAGALVVITLAAVAGLLPAWAPLLALFASALANLELLRLFGRRKGVLFALGGLLFHQIYYLYSSAAFVWSYLTHRLAASGRRP